MSFTTVTEKLGIPGFLKSQRVRSRRDLRDMGFFYTALGASLIVIAVLFVYLWSRLTVINIGYEISRANAVRTVLIEKNKRLRLELVRLRSPERIERIASKELGLTYPTNEQIIRIK